ncbi:hypothetical protein GNI_079000 [Gregarina niphandrodes]|uniref:Uncharacterized protein n=1 Tax=Gregarina niphandrodes TaxID=110365 RepID=A0A023B6K7_GRENI|nr:hypothetical protein GNI_079000 [Gregarina niphandrodes]EZG66581.1 hypothetical protein GNI_079000 [Gregarina niphandrodes]|eukprot:XP_011130590.1 hypothetical protein GNI_079000 [Gregarina niphandrodes]
MGVADDLLPLVCRDVCTLTELPPRRFWYSFICILQQAYQNSLRHRSSYAPSTSTSTMPTTADSSLDQAGSQPPSRSELCSSAIQDLEPALEDTATTAPTAETNPTTDLQAALTYRKQLSSDDSNYPIIQDYSTLQNKLLSPDELTCTWECGLARLVAQAIERLVNLLQAFIDNNPNKVNSEHMQRSMFYLGICVGIVCGVGEYSRIPEQRRLVVLPAGGACGLLTNECREMTKFRSSCWATVLLYKTALLRAEQASGVRLALLLDD